MERHDWTEVALDCFSVAQCFLGGRGVTDWRPSYHPVLSTDGGWPSDLKPREWARCRFTACQHCCLLSTCVWWFLFPERLSDPRLAWSECRQERAAGSTPAKKDLCEGSQRDQEEHCGPAPLKPSMGSWGRGNLGPIPLWNPSTRLHCHACNRRHYFMYRNVLCLTVGLLEEKCDATLTLQSWMCRRRRSCDSATHRSSAQVVLADSAAANWRRGWGRGVVSKAPLGSDWTERETPPQNSSNCANVKACQ